MNTIVLKFGGSSVADNEKLKKVAGKIATLADEGYSIITVVSAQGKKTDSLLNEAYELSKKPNERELDVLLSTGEQASIAKLSILLNELGYKAISLTGWQAGIYTNLKNQNAIIEHIDTTRIKKELEQNKIVIVAGFQGLNENMDITTLGRGGSDTTAVALAAAMGSKKCYIYSDVEGVFTADPRKVSSVEKNEFISYDEMLDIANEGAKVLHNRCIEIGKKFNIPIVAKSTFKEDDGTIVNYIEEQRIKSLVKNDDLMEMYISKDKDSYSDLCKYLINNKIVPLEVVNNKDNIYVLFKLNEFQKANINRMESITSHIIHSGQITRISIVGSDISNNNSVLEYVYSILLNEAEHIEKIEICNSKIRITFNEALDNTYFKNVHDLLIEKNSIC